jgi:imidazolonepropionase-like amidohydrolase
MRHVLALLLCLLSLPGWSGTRGAVARNALQPEVAPLPIAVRAARMLDVRAGAYVPNAIVLVENGRITAAGASVPIPATAQIKDLGNATLLPGLIDCHTHLLLNFDRALDEDRNLLLQVAQMSTAKRALLGAQMGRQDLLAGITTVRDAGNSGVNGDVALRDAINAGWVEGPRVVACTRALAAAGGQFGGLAPEAQPLIAQEYAVISGPEEARKAVRQALYDGADAIKVIVDTYPRVLSLEELKAIVEEAHRVGRKVAAHAVTDMAIRLAATAGVDSVEHGYGASDESLQLMAQKQVFLVPTDGPADVYTAIFVDSHQLPPAEREAALARFQRLAAQHHQRLTRAVKAGVRIAAGSDMYFSVPGLTRGEASLTMLRAYAAAGMTPLEIIRAATLNAADLLGWQNRVGSLEPGKFADLIGMRDDPLKDVSALARVGFVMKGGAIMKDDLAARP